MDDINSERISRLQARYPGNKKRPLEPWKDKEHYPEFFKLLEESSKESTHTSKDSDLCNEDTSYEDQWMEAMMNAITYDMNMGLCFNVAFPGEYRAWSEKYKKWSNERDSWVQKQIKRGRW